MSKLWIERVDLNPGQITVLCMCSWKLNILSWNLIENYWITGKSKAKLPHCPCVKINITGVFQLTTHKSSSEKWYRILKAQMMAVWSSLNILPFPALINYQNTIFQNWIIEFLFFLQHCVEFCFVLLYRTVSSYCILMNEAACVCLFSVMRHLKIVNGKWISFKDGL